MSEKKSWEVHPLNLKFRSDNKIQGGLSPLDILLNDFGNFINSLRKPLIIDMVCDYEQLLFNKTVRMCNFDKMIFSSEEDLEILFSANNMKFSKCETREWRIEEEHPQHMVLDGGLHSKVYNLTNLHDDLPPGWIYTLYSIADFVRVFIDPIDSEKHAKTINAHKSLQKTKSSTDGINQVSDIDAIKELVIIKNVEHLFFTKVIAGVIGLDKKQLSEKQKRFEHLCNNIGQLYSEDHHQYPTLHGRHGRKFLTVKSSMPAFVPFHTSEIYEEGEFLIGVNPFTGHPVKINPNNRLNRNMVLAATSGSGKTTLAMMMIHSFDKMYPNSFQFGIDPENEYKAIGDNMGFHYIDYAQGMRLGFDTFRLMPDTIAAAEILCDVLHIPEVERTLPMLVASEMSGLLETDRTFSHFYDTLVDKEKSGKTNFTPSQYFDIMNNQPVKSILEGKPPDSNKIILSLKNIGSAGGTMHRIFTQIALSYATGKALMMPKIIPKQFMLDEVWMLLQHTSLGNSIQNLSRRGRKYNIDMMMATQNIEDMTNNEAARNVLVNSDTVVFLRQSEVTIKSLLEHFVLSDEEVKYLLELKKGHALIKYGNDSVPVNILPDSEQLKLFRPK